MSAGDPICGCGCGSWVGQCRRALPAFVYPVAPWLGNHPPPADNEAAFLFASREALVSMLLDVQADAIAKGKRIAELEKHLAHCTIAASDEPHVEEPAPTPFSVSDAELEGDSRIVNGYRYGR